MLSDFVMETEKMDQDMNADSEITSTRVESEETKDEGIFLEAKEETTPKFSWLPSLLDNVKILMDPGQFRSRHCGEGNAKPLRNYESLSQLILPSAPGTQCQKNNVKLVHIECSHCGNRFRKNVLNPSSKRSDCKQKKESRRFKRKMRRLTKQLEKL